MRTSMFTILSRALAVLAIVAVVLSAAPSTARAYGKDALWQVGVSFNCNTPAACGPELGGFWAWLEFDEGFTGDATAAGCSHLSSPSGPGAGADAFQADFTWVIAPAVIPPFGVDHFWITGGTMTLTGGIGGPPVTVPIMGPMGPPPFDSGIPAAAGHYNTEAFFGFAPPPGVAYQMQVVELPH